MKPEIKTKPKPVEEVLPAQPATATTTSTSAAPPAAPVPQPHCTEPPPRPRLSGWLHTPPETPLQLRGTVATLTAAYDPAGSVVRVQFGLPDYDSCVLLLDHDHTRAAILTLQNSLTECSRHCRGYGKPRADFPQRSGQARGDLFEGPPVADQEFRFAFLPHRDLISASATFVWQGGGGYFWAWLARTQAEALLFDLERGLADLEQCEGVLL